MSNTNNALSNNNHQNINVPYNSSNPQPQNIGYSSQQQGPYQRNGTIVSETGMAPAPMLQSTDHPLNVGFSSGNAQNQDMPYQSGGYQQPMNNNYPEEPQSNIIFPIVPVQQPQQPVVQAHPINIPQDVIIIQENQIKIEIKDKKKYPPFPMWVAITCLIVNLCFPGIGTWIASCNMATSAYSSKYYCCGLCELLTFFIIIGWCLALCNSIKFLGAASNGVSVEEYCSTS